MKASDKLYAIVLILLLSAIWPRVFVPIAVILVVFLIVGNRLKVQAAEKQKLVDQEKAKRRQKEKDLNKKKEIKAESDRQEALSARMALFRDEASTWPIDHLRYQHQDLRQLIRDADDEYRRTSVERVNTLNIYNKKMDSSMVLDVIVQLDRQQTEAIEPFDNLLIKIQQKKQELEKKIEIIKDLMKDKIKD